MPRPGEPARIWFCHSLNLLEAQQKQKQEYNVIQSVNWWVNLQTWLDPLSSPGTRQQALVHRHGDRDLQ